MNKNLQKSYSEFAKKGYYFLRPVDYLSTLMLMLKLCSGLKVLQNKEKEN